MVRMQTVYGLGSGGTLPMLPPPIHFQTAPTINQMNYEIGQIVYTGSPGSYTFYMYAGAGVWDQLSTGGSTTVAGTANQITATPSGSTTTLSIPATFTAPGSVTATTGNITATNGNIVFGSAGNKTVYNSVGTTTAAGANSAGSVALVAGTATVATTAVTANSLIRLTGQGINASTAIGVLHVSAKTAGTSFVITSYTAGAVTTATGDLSTVFWEIVN